MHLQYNPFRAIARVACIVFAVVLRVLAWSLRCLSWTLGTVAKIMSRRGAEVGRTFMSKFLVNNFGSKSKVLAVKDADGNMKLFSVRPY